MIVRKLLKLQADIEDRKVPCDMHDDELNQHYSESKGQFQNILDMYLLCAIDVAKTTVGLSSAYRNQWVTRSPTNLGVFIRLFRPRFS